VSSHLHQSLLLYGQWFVDGISHSIVDVCTAQYKSRLSDCTANDWSCLCQESTNLLTCYNNCPKDSSMLCLCSAADGLAANQTKQTGVAFRARSHPTAELPLPPIRARRRLILRKRLRVPMLRLLPLPPPPAPTFFPPPRLLLPSLPPPPLRAALVSC
jgi:hypothetical protein